RRQRHPAEAPRTPERPAKPGQVPQLAADLHARRDEERTMNPDERDPRLAGLAQPVVSRAENDPTVTRLHPVLSDEQLLELLSELPEWRLEQGRLVRAARFATDEEARRA